MRVTDRLLDHLERLGLRLLDQLLLQGAGGPPSRVDEVEGLGLGVRTVLGCLRVRRVGDLSALRLRSRDLRVEGRDPLVHPGPLLIDGAAAGIQERAGGLGRRDRLGALPETSLPRGCEVGGLRLCRHRLGRQSLGRDHLRIGLDQARLGLGQARLRFGEAVVGLLRSRVRLGEASSACCARAVHLRKPRLPPDAAWTSASARRASASVACSWAADIRASASTSRSSACLARASAWWNATSAVAICLAATARSASGAPGDVLGPRFGLADQLTRAPLRVGHHLAGDDRRLLSQGLRSGEDGRHLRASLLHLVDQPGACPNGVAPQLGRILLGGAADVARGLLGVEEEPFALLDGLGDDVDGDARGEVAGHALIGRWLPGSELHAPMVHPNEASTSHSSPRCCGMEARSRAAERVVDPGRQGGGGFRSGARPRRRGGSSGSRSRPGSSW